MESNTIPVPSWQAEQIPPTKSTATQYLNDRGLEIETVRQSLASIPGSAAATQIVLLYEILNELKNAQPSSDSVNAARVLLNVVAENAAKEESSQPGIIERIRRRIV
jgi:hypothetical protein